MQTITAAILPAHLQRKRTDRLSRDQAAAFLGLRPKTLAVWACTGRHSLPMVKVGRRVFYELADLEAFIARQKRTHTGQSEKTHSEVENPDNGN